MCYFLVTAKPEALSLGTGFQSGYRRSFPHSGFLQPQPEKYPHSMMLPLLCFTVGLGLVILLIVQVNCSAQIPCLYGEIVCNNTAFIWINPVLYSSLSPQD